MSCLAWFKELIADVRNPKDFYASLRFLILFGFIFGFMPLEVVSQKRRLNVDGFGYFNVTLRIVLYLLCYIYAKAMNESILRYFLSSDITRITEQIQDFNAMLCILVILIFCLHEIRHFIKFINYCEDIERVFAHVGIDFIHSVSSRWINRNIARTWLSNVGFIIVSRYIILGRMESGPSAVSSVCFYSPHIIVCGVVVFCNTANFKITEHLCAINKVIHM